jgi:cell division protein FtsA
LRQYLCEILEPRVEEILNFANTEIQKSGLSQLVGSGVVLTGGASQLEGLCEMGEFIFDMPVRIGMPTQFSGLSDIVQSPSYATANGIIKYAFEQMLTQSEKPHAIEMMGQWFERVKDMVDQAL